ncbi:MAG: hypothetical protein VYC39_12950 [Myxococcota bacterium]|nr:hypothetical protein [Myxococcota bacterium]
MSNSVAVNFAICCTTALTGCNQESLITLLSRKFLRQSILYVHEDVLAPGLSPFLRRQIQLCLLSLSVWYFLKQLTFAAISMVAEVNRRVVHKKTVLISYAQYGYGRGTAL